MTKMFRALAIALGLFAFMPANAAITASSTSGLLTLLMNAKGGETITLAPGSYSIGLSNKSYSPAVIVNAAGAQFGPYAKITNVQNLTIDGAKWKGPSTDPGGAYALRPSKTVNLHLRNITWAGQAQKGTAVYSKSSDYNVGLVISGGTATSWMDAFTLFDVHSSALTAVKASQLGGDFVKIANSSNVTVGYNTVFSPVYVGSHPDGGQLQGGNDGITFEYNTLTGSFQGFDNFGFGAGYKNINVTVRFNTITQGTYPNSIVFDNITGQITGNKITSGKYKAIFRTGGASHSGNVIDGKAVD